MEYDEHDPVAMLRIDKKAALAANKEFEAKKWCWIADPKEGYKAAEIKSTKGDIVVVETNDGKEEQVKKDNTEQMNPPKYEKTEDMANLTYLNEASVIHNLKQRYFAGLIYTYSGLFCVAINPYRRLPIYTEKVVFAYRGKRKNEMPPHIFSICDNAYQNMLQDRENQSMLITGESGAGKTENTKKVIQYLAHVSGGMGDKKDAGGAAKSSTSSLEDQVIQTNPILEAYGNAKTIRNNNSSRFGKFIRCHFGPQGKLAGADIEQYLLEKSRVIFQQSIERNYHIFYQILKGSTKEVLAELLLDSNKKDDYAFLEKGSEIAEGIDDVEEFHLTELAADTLGFTPEEKLTMYKICASCLHWGNAKFKQRPREEQAEVSDPKDLDKVSFLLKLAGADFVKNIIKPRIKVGREYVNQGRNVQQVAYSIGALTKSLYERMFFWLVEKANQTLMTKDRRAFFIGVLDIAGFEIFELNSFEQLCINVTNEKLQQFFNHHMFVLEQEEYKREGIHWEFIDFGLDLLPTIDLIFAKGTGIFAILEEECIVPKASDQTLLSKLVATHDGKSVKFGRPKISGKKTCNYHFEVHHYAGSVGYNIDSWLDKNKDPINEAVASIFAKSSDPFIAHLWKDYATEGHRGKGGSFMTVSAKHKEQLNKLMETLYSTSPHFVRCIIPNELKKAGVIDTQLVLHQLRCNGVLEGIRICRKGFPNRIPFQEFKQRYQILAPSAVSGQFMDGRKACETLLGALTLEENEYRIGTTKVFFRAGVLGQLEDMRDERLAKIISMFQAYCKGYLMRKEYRKMCDQRIGISVIQRNVRKYLYLRNWNWWKLYTKVKPLLQVARADEEMKQKMEQLKEIEEKAQKEEALRKELEEKYTKLVEEKSLLFQDFQREQDAAADAEERATALDSKKNELEAQLKEMLDQLEDEEEASAELSGVKHKLESEISELKQDVEELDGALKKAEEEGKQKDKNIEQLSEELQQQDEAIAKVSKAKKQVEEQCAELEDHLQEEQNKVNHLNKVKQKLEETLDETNLSFEREKKLRADVEKVKRKVEGDLKATQDNLAEVQAEKLKTEEELKKREQNIAQLSGKIEDQSSLIDQLRKKIKQLEGRIEELEEELENERNNRSKSERARQELEQELDDLNDRLDEAGGATAAQMDLNKKREQDIVKLRKDLEEQSLANEQTVNSLRAKQNQALQELQDELDNVKKSKAKIEKEKSSLQNEGDDLAVTVETLQKQKQQSEKNNRALSDQLNESRAQNDDLKKNVSELEVIRGRFTQENVELSRVVEEFENKNAQLGKNKKNLDQQVEEFKKQLEDEIRAKSEAASRLKNIEADYDTLTENFEELEDGKADMQKQLSRANAELQTWKSKFEQEGTAKLEELEDAKRKMTAKLAETEESLNGALTKAASAEKAKNRLNGELEDALIDLEKAQTNNSALEKKQKKIDQEINEWKTKLDEVQNDLDISQKDARNYSTEMYRLKGTNDELSELIESLKRENKALQGEVSDLSDQLGEGGKSVVELGKLKKRLEMEKEELQTAVEEAEGALEAEEGKVLKVQLELTQLRQEFERKIADRDEEIDNLRKNQQRQLDALQGSLDAEVKSKNEQARLRKKFESDCIELENNCENLMRGNQELQKNIKKHQQQVKDLQVMVEEEQRGRDDARDAAARAERRAAELNAELEDLRNQLEQADRARRAADQEKTEAVDRLSELTTQVTNLQQAKRKLDGQVNTMQEELDDAENEAKAADDRAKKAAADLLRVQAELLSAQDAAGSAERARLSAERIQNELQLKIEELEAAGGKALKNQIKKLEQRIKELERDLDGEAKRSNEAQKFAKKNERRMKEIQFQADEDQKNLSRAQENSDRLNNKIKKMRVAVEEAEGLAASNLARYRKAQGELEESEERIEGLESSLQKARGRGGGRSSGVMRTSSRETSRRGFSSTRSGSSASLEDE